nr:hypothetical protein Itr_chr04CG17190 [Ipomoea trifida]
MTTGSHFHSSTGKGVGPSFNGDDWIGLAKAYGAQRIISGETRVILGVGELRVRVDDGLLEANDGDVLSRPGIVIILVRGHKDHAVEIDTVLSGGGKRLFLAKAAAAGGDCPAAAIGSEKESGEEEKEAKGDSNGVA